MNRNTYTYIFGGEISPETAQKIRENVSLMIVEYRVKKARILAYVHGFIVLVSVAIIIPSVSDIVSELSNSDFFNYLSLASSDGFGLAGAWKEYAYSLLSSWPLVGSTVLLGGTIILINSARLLKNNISYNSNVLQRIQ